MAAAVPARAARKIGASILLMSVGDGLSEREVGFDVGGGLK